MDINDRDSSKVSETIQKATSGAIILPANPSTDTVAAASALYLGLTKLGKNVSLVCDMTPKSDLMAADKIQKQLTTSGDNLIISFPYTDGSIDKVDYNIQGETFNLIVTPRQGNSKLDSQKVKFSYGGGDMDFIITLDAPNLNSLGNSFIDNKKMFQGKTIINIDRHLVNDFYGTVNIVNKISSSISELAFRFLEEAGCEMDKDIATNLYAGLVSATNNFSSYSVNAETFEIAAALLKSGAAKKQVKPLQPQQTQQNQFPPRKQFNQQRDNSNQIQQPIKHAHSNEKQIKPIEDVEYEESSDENNTSSNWLKPKIFRGTGLV